MAYFGFGNFQGGFTYQRKFFPIYFFVISIRFSVILITIIFRFPSLKKNLNIYQRALEEFTLNTDKSLQGKQSKSIRDCNDNVGCTK